MSGSDGAGYWEKRAVRAEERVHGLLRRIEELESRVASSEKRAEAAEASAWKWEQAASENMRQALKAKDERDEAQEYNRESDRERAGWVKRALSAEAEVARVRGAVSHDA